ncbi:MAG TPA: phosphoenolpyruvate carboxylase [Steroidobacteraceae bacterium]|nr:phosphoenolpyruvate carboxylase [Steroidobacteraceae bacterium]
MKRTEIHFPPKHEALREDVHALGELLGELLREQGGPQLLETVEQDRVLAIRRREGDSGAAAELALRVRGRPPAEARDLVRAFSTWFQAVNLAEKVHRIRRRRHYFLKESARPQPGGVEDALASLKERGLALEEVLALIGSLRIEPVFAAHPTESLRRTILRSQQRIAELLLGRLDPTLTPRDSRSLWRRVRQELTAGWQTEDHPREKLTVSDEREHVLYYLSEVLYRAVPTFYEEIADALAGLYDVKPEALELPAIVSFGTWVGGDMDGNPDVHGKTIRETLARQQQVIVHAYYEECQSLAQRLSQSASRIDVSAALSKRIDEYATLLPGARAVTPARHDRMPYRVFLAQIGARLINTFEGRANGYERAAELRADVQLIADSLRAHRGWNAGHHSVQRLLRRIDTFGLHLATLDVRQHASVHHDVLARALDDPEWRARPSAERHRLIAQAIERDGGPLVDLDPLGRRTRGVFESIVAGRHRYGAAAVGYYIVSGAQDVDDVLAALLLARWADVCDKRTGEVALDIAPMFESLDALEGSGEIMRRLLSDPLYRRHLDTRRHRQCVVLGYADADKEGGLCAARFAIQVAQAELARAFTEGRVSHVLCHARGGSVALGGGRIDTPARAAPDAAVNGVLRLTEQGEVVNQSYGLLPIAMRTLERAFNALAVRTAAVRTAGAPRAVPQAHAACAATLAASSRAAYRQLVYGDARFHEYFRLVTPIDVLERMQIGSRPAYRGEGESLQLLRPVPWAFAWTQSRFLLPAWYGAGSGFSETLERHGLAVLREAYDSWFFLRNLIDDVEATLARTDLEIARAYDALAPRALQPFFEDICREYALARERLLEIKGTRELLDGDATLQRAIALRNPYVDPMNLMQIDLLKRWRATGRQDRDLFDALLASVSGIAQGLQSTG